MQAPSASHTPDRPDDDQALALTVHGLPAPEAVLAADARRTRRGRWHMLLLALVCFAPVLASYFSFFVVQPRGAPQFGTLIEPPQLMPDVQVRQDGGPPMPLRSLRGQWLLLSVAGAACDARCESNLYLQRQLREMLGKDKDRLDWVWLVSDSQPVRTDLQPALATATVLHVPEATLANWLQAEPDHNLSDHLYVVDPMGRWMMRFPAGMEAGQATQARRDLGRLLRASASWDQAGRGVTGPQP